ncbi:ABC transporter permease [Deinococcus multiflagellatus]|uniref:ABC transporter permease n=1 Tax=Deinococcus multiflagellatus TaxID=1656887 RepID=A0ABW1ZLS1_9DEIO
MLREGQDVLTVTQQGQPVGTVHWTDLRARAPGEAAPALGRAAVARAAGAVPVARGHAPAAESPGRGRAGPPGPAAVAPDADPPGSGGRRHAAGGGCGPAAGGCRHAPRLDRPRQLTEALVGLGQTVPTFAILALAVPALGFGWAPTLLGLVLYGLGPVVGQAILGLQGVSPGVLDAARGMGMSGAQRLWRVELPLAAPVLLSGLRTSVVYNVGTATVGAALGAGGLGEPIIGGLSQQNTALVLAGALPAALLALTLDAWLALVQRPAGAEL